MKSSFEKGIDKKEEAPESDVARLWQEFKFKTKPPQENSLAEERLKNLCDEYIKLILSRKIIIGSDDKRRKLHNKISIMILGKSRDDLSLEQADDIANFASRWVVGCSLGEAQEDFRKHEAA